ncbi:MAG: hypothetical protein WA001_05000 [Patescibacteria group bacterium]
MTFQEGILYHQITPAKLTTDVLSAIVALYFLWLHSWMLAIVIAIFPPIVASVLVLSLVDLGHIKKSKVGKYLKQNMTFMMEVLRLFGFFVMAWGAWVRQPAVLVLGAALILYGWLHGIELKK